MFSLAAFSVVVAVKYVRQRARQTRTFRPLEQEFDEEALVSGEDEAIE